MFKTNGSFPTTYLDFINESITNAMGSNITGKTILEIGDNDTTYDLNDFVKRGMVHTLLEPCKMNDDGTIGAPYMLNLGQNYVPKVLEDADNLSEYMNYFDVITNIGCLEHIEPVEVQYEIWKNLHNMLKVGGVMIHIMPDDEECDKYLRWLGHCHLYFQMAFYENLVDKLGYEIVHNDLLNFNRSVALKKTTTSAFNLNKEEFLALITIR